jgi:membrane protease YdiL (CAAX protease family)
MADLLWRFGFILAVGSLIWLLHRHVGVYPAAIPYTENPARDIRITLLLWGIAMIFPILMMFWISPLLDRTVPDRTLNQLIQVPIRSMPYLLLPLFLIIKKQRWSLTDLGLSRRNKSWSVTIFAILVGLGSGAIAYFTGRANISIQVLGWGELLLLVYNNSFLEEFYHRGLIQSLLERVGGQRMAIVWGGILFGLTHVVFDVSALKETGGVLAVLSAILLQTMAGWLFGIIYMKTRNLWPGIACHYLANWLPSILVGLAGGGFF